MKEYNVKDELKRDWPFLIALLAVVISSVLIYPSLPDKIAVHWNLGGEADRFLNKTIGVFLLPILGLGIYIYNLFMPCTNSQEPI